METVKLTINGREVTAPKGELLIEVCEMQGIYLPRFCHFRGLTAQASCRMCVVRIEKIPKLQTACTVPVTEGMVVNTESQEIEETRSAMIEFLLSNHPVDCPVCDRAGECELQDQTYGFGEDRTRSRFQDKETTLERQISPFIYNDPQRCVVCKRCTRVCEEWMDEFAITTVNRGSHTLISSFSGWVECSDCGNCVDVCPTGTLLHVPYKYIVRPWDLKQTPTICNFCSDGCSILAGTRSEEMVRAVARDGRGRTAGGINHDFLCALGRYSIDFVHNPERIEQPLIRRGGQLVPTTWDDALRFVADGLSEVRKEHGGDAIGVMSAPRLLNEDQYVLRKFATDVLETKNAGFFRDDDEIDLNSFFKYGSPPIATQEHIQQADTILLIGSDPNEENPLTAFSIRWAVRQKSARLLIVNSMGSRLERQADIALRVREGSEPAAIAGLLDPGLLSSVANATGVSSENWNGLRQALLESQHAVIIFGDEVSGSAAEALSLLERTLATPNAETAQAARKARLDALASEVRSTNSTQKPAINENPYTYIVPHPTLAVAHEPVAWSSKFYFVPLVRYSNSLGAFQMGLSSAVRFSSDGAIKALYVAGEDLVARANASGDPAGLRSMLEGLEGLELLVVQDMFLTETARLAHVVLPVTSFAESQGTQVNNGGQVQLVRRAIPPLGQARPDWMVVNSLARLMGNEWGYQGSVKSIFKEISERVDGYAGLSHNRLAAEGASATKPRAVDLSRIDQGELTSRLAREIEKIDTAVPIDHAPLEAKAGSRLHRRYPQITRYSDNLPPGPAESEEERSVPLVFPA